MNFFSQIPIVSWFCLAIALFIAVMNGLTLWKNSYSNHPSSFVPLVGFIFFYFGTLGWDESIYFWLLALLDFGTVTFIIAIPFLTKEIFDNSIFARHAIYQNNEQVLTLYKTKNSQNFNWRWIGKIPTASMERQPPFMSNFGGDWEIVDNQLHLKTYDGTIATATILENKIVFDKIQSNNYYWLQKAVLRQKFKK